MLRMIVVLMIYILQHYEYLFVYVFVIVCFLLEGCNMCMDDKIVSKSFSDIQEDMHNDLLKLLYRMTEEEIQLYHYFYTNRSRIDGD